ncbi:MAG TPA: DUF4832 domain-containing protein [Kofleriaceae bacterium]|nr:DUF4832 domain-containing protein [Kofleriaceae bacterium]
MVITSRGAILLATLPAIAGLIACDAGTVTNIDSHDDDTPGSDGAGDPAGGPDGGSSADDEGPTITLDFVEATNQLVNPERGYYVGLDLLSGEGARDVRASGHTLAIAIVRLDDYRDRPLDSALLGALRVGLSEVRAAGIKIILRFAYNEGYEGDASRSRILGHISQLAPILSDHSDVIAVVQAGFIGAWGEWHSSTNGLDNNADRSAILSALLAAVPASRTVQIRTPMYKEAIFPGGPLDSEEAWSDDDRARVGHHNDCFLASASDYGTFANPIAEWENYVEQDGRFLPIGGETCALNAPKTDCEQALAFMRAQHWSYLNEEYNQAVLDAWDEQGCGDEIRRRLGYRLALVNATLSESVAPGGVLRIDLEIANRGFSAPFNRRPIMLVLQRGNSLRWAVELDGRDARQLQPGRTTISTRLRIPATAPTGDDWQLSLWLPDDEPGLRDDPRYSIRLANPGVWDEATGVNVITRSLRVDESAPGAIDPEATELTELP